MVKGENPGVYQIPCCQCSKAYVCQTGRNLDTRITKHVPEHQQCLSHRPVIVTSKEACLFAFIEKSPKRTLQRLRHTSLRSVCSAVLIHLPTGRTVPAGCLVLQELPNDILVCPIHQPLWKGFLALLARFSTQIVPG